MKRSVSISLLFLVNFLQNVEVIRYNVTNTYRRRILLNEYSKLCGGSPDSPEGTCLNFATCLATGGDTEISVSGCESLTGFCCKHTVKGGGTVSSRVALWQNEDFPGTTSGSNSYSLVIKPHKNTCYIKLEFVDAVFTSSTPDSCGANHLTILGQSEGHSALICGTLTGYQTFISVGSTTIGPVGYNNKIRLTLSLKDDPHRFKVKLVQVQCSMVQTFNGGKKRRRKRRDTRFISATEIKRKRDLISDFVKNIYNHDKNDWDYYSKRRNNRTKINRKHISANSNKGNRLHYRTTAKSLRNGRRVDSKFFKKKKAVERDDRLSDLLAVIKEYEKNNDTQIITELYKTLNRAPSYNPNYNYGYTSSLKDINFRENKPQFYEINKNNWTNLENMFLEDYISDFSAVNQTWPEDYIQETDIVRDHNQIGFKKTSDIKLNEKDVINEFLRIYGSNDPKKVYETIMLNSLSNALLVAGLEETSNGPKQNISEKVEPPTLNFRQAIEGGLLSDEDKVFVRSLCSDFEPSNLLRVEGTALPLLGNLAQYFGFMLLKNDVGQFFFCSVTLISSDIALTTSTCVLRKGLDSNGYEIRVFFNYQSLLAVGTRTFELLWGRPGSIFVDKVTFHPAYDHDNYHYDLAILHLREAVPNASPIGFTNPSDAVTSDQLFIMGFGSFELLNTVDQYQEFARYQQGQAINNTLCEDRLRGASTLPLSYTNTFIKDQYLCIDTAGNQLCSGDEGGPVVKNLFSGAILVGIAAGNINPCLAGSTTLGQYPNIAVRITSVTSFIDVASTTLDFTTEQYWPNSVWAAVGSLF